MKKLSLCLGLAVVGVGGLLTGCQSGQEDQPVDRTAMLNKDDRVSDVPWNKPQGWENRGQLGQLANDPRIGGGQ